MMSKKMEKKTEKMRSSENRKTTMSRIQLHRLARLASLLKRNGYHSPADILEEYYSLEHVDGLVPHDRYCIRTVFRDVQILREEFNCPLAYDRKNKGYYLKHHGWDFNCPADLSESALLALIIGAKIAEDVIPEPLKGRIKIAVDEILKGNNPDFLDTTLINSLLVFAESGATDISAIFPVVFEAWQQHRYLKILYDDKQGNPPTERIIAPHVLFLYDKEWRLKAYCTLRNAPRTFVISRIVDVKILDETFEPDMKIIRSVSRDNIVSYKPVVNVKIRLFGRARKFAEANLMHTRQTLQKEPDRDSWIFSIPAVPAEIIVPWILSQGGDAVPLSPQSIVEAVQEKSDRLSKMFA